MKAVPTREKFMTTVGGGESEATVVEDIKVELHLNLSPSLSVSCPRAIHWLAHVVHSAHATCANIRVFGNTHTHTNHMHMQAYTEAFSRHLGVLNAFYDANKLDS